MLEKSVRNRSKVRIFIIDDHPIVVLGIAHLIQQQADMEVCGYSERVEHALRLLSQKPPSLLISEISLKGMDGIELIKQVKGLHPNLPILIFSRQDEAIFAQRALQAGASGYVMKHEPTSVLLNAIRRVLDGQIYLSEAMMARMMRQLSRMRSGPTDDPEEVLSKRELQVFRKIGEGLGTSEIANVFGLSIKTVETHKQHIKTKLQLSNSYELVYHAIQYCNKPVIK